MIEKTYMVRFETPENSAQYMTAASAKVDGENLVFLNSIGEPVAVFLLEIVESWTLINLSKCPRALITRLAPSAPGTMGRYQC
jgi:hypothetical protein